MTQRMKEQQLQFGTSPRSSATLEAERGDGRPREDIPTDKGHFKISNFNVGDLAAKRVSVEFNRIFKSCYFVCSTETFAYRAFEMELFFFFLERVPVIYAPAKKLADREKRVGE